MFFIRFWKKKVGTVEAYLLKGINEILPPVLFYFSSDFKKNRYVGIVFSERYKLNFAPYCLYFSSGFGKKKSVQWKCIYWRV